MKRLILTLAAVATLAPQLAASQASEPGSLTIDFHGLKTHRGVVLAALFDSRTTYDANARPIRSWTLPAGGGDFSVTVAGLRPGDYAIKAFHDVDGNGKMNFSPIGYPMEPYAFSNNARGMFGPPAWRQAAFHVSAGVNDQSIRLH